MPGDLYCSCADLGWSRRSEAKADEAGRAGYNEDRAKPEGRVFVGRKRTAGWTPGRFREK